MSSNRSTGFWDSFLPPRYPFQKALGRHSAKMLEGVETLSLWFESGDPALAERVRDIEHEADDIMMEISNQLARVFITPMDSEDIRMLSGALDQILNYCKNTVRELDIFQVTPDDCMKAIIREILDGARAIHEAVRMLPKMNVDISGHIKDAIKSERRVEKIYRIGLNDLFNGDDLKEILKKREVYRHLSNTADRVWEAANLLASLNLKYS